MDPPPPLSPQDADSLRTLIRHKVRKYRRAVGSRQDTEDLEQDLACRALERLPKFDPARARLQTFFSRILDHLLIDLERERRAQKRQSTTLPLSLEASADSQTEGAPVWQTLPEDRRYVSTAGPLRSEVDLVDLREDLETVLASLTSDQRSLAELLKHVSVTEAASELGVHRGTLYRKWQAVTSEFEDSGLREYLS